MILGKGRSPYLPNFPFFLKAIALSLDITIRESDRPFSQDYN
ncbi:MAG: hypothetical protein VKJ64_22090 [Leptolyngbyaceae bacterium]|nr:hypothetical protein [Leptolyngbyaceae bacterium]